MATADKACLSCALKKPRCDRAVPVRSRCRKTRQGCSYNRHQFTLAVGTAVSPSGRDRVNQGAVFYQRLGQDGIVFINLGSTVSGSTIGTSERPPSRLPVEAHEELDENWSI